MNGFIKILIFDRYPVFGMGIKLILEKENNIIVEKILKNPAIYLPQVTKIQPDLLVITSIHAADGNLPLIRKIKIHFPHIPVLVIVDEKSSYQADELINLNVEGIMGADFDPEILVRAIHKIFRGKRFFSERKWEEIYLSRKNHWQNISGHNTQTSVLSQRETEILKKLAEGLTHKEIGLQLSIRHRTVETHRNKILSKLNLRNTAELIRFAAQHALL
jgi:two-component system, NarL family, invasion response regulator UvrY